MTNEVAALIAAERVRQDAKWGQQDHRDLFWFPILVEEVGEVAKALIEGDKNSAMRELIEVAAVAVQWLEAMGRQGSVEVGR